MHSRPQDQVLQFLLVSDASAARRLRRTLALAKARTGLLVGTWPDLLRRSLGAYCLSHDEASERRRLERALAETNDAFWSRSLEVAPEETASEVLGALNRLLEATDPQRGLWPEDAERLDGRLGEVLGNLTRLVKTADGSLPGDLGAIRRVLRADSRTVLRPVLVCRSDGLPKLSRWQCALIERLNRDASRTGVSPDPELAAILEDESAFRARGRPGSALRALQVHLFAPDGSAAGAAIDDSVQCVRVRDYYQEAETAAGMVQRLLKEQAGLTPAEVGILLPDDFGYFLAVEDAFRLAGLSASGLPGERWRRDLGAEAVLHFLSCQQKPAPAMALAACLSSPLMPWTVEEGGGMAQRVMDGRYDLRAPRNGGPGTAAMLDLIQQGGSEPSAVETALGSFVSLLAGDGSLADHVERAREAAARARELLAPASEIDWVELRRAVTPRYIADGKPTSYTLEGVTVLREGHEPWRTVRHLLVLGFSAGRYPRGTRLSAVFSAENLRSIRNTLDIPIDSPSEALRRRRQLFRRQLCAASESVTFLMPRRHEKGDEQAPSESMVFIERLLSRGGEGASLIHEPDSPGDRARIRHLARAAPERVSPPRVFDCAELDLERDLVGLRKDGRGKPRPESPSSLETLLVSPLAWLLRQIGAEPVNWAPETAGPNILGSLAHGAFELMFRPAADLPERESLQARTSATLDEVALQQAPFFRNPKWRVERMHLSEQAGRAAVAWRDTLKSLGAEVLASEVWLQGTWSGIGIHGQADLILGLGAGRLLVVDYKWSMSGTRRRRMENRFDSQAHLYRAMLESGGPKPLRHQPNGSEREALARRLKTANEIGIVYFMMKDRIFLADGPLPRRLSVRGWDAVGEDVAELATTGIAESLAELRKGIVRLNEESDREFFADVGLSPYALDVSPLVDLFTIPPGDG